VSAIRDRSGRRWPERIRKERTNGEGADQRECGALGPDGAVVADDGGGGEVVVALDLAHEVLVDVGLPRHPFRPCCCSAATCKQEEEEEDDRWEELALTYAGVPGGVHGINRGAGAAVWRRTGSPPLGVGPSFGALCLCAARHWP
jgi:hypothetical protein